MTEPASDEIRSLSARSLALSALLGTHPPRLPVSSMVALGELFGIAPAAMRTALSRMVSAGEATSVDGRYELRGRPLARQGQQDRALTAPVETDDGAWWTVLVLAGRRPLAERRHFRKRMEAGVLGELRPDTWLRPANTPLPTLGSDEAIVLRSVPVGRDPLDLVATLWDLGALEGRARMLHEDVVAAVAPSTADGDLRVEAIPDAFVASASAIRFLRSEPWLPPSLHRSEPIDALRTAYVGAQDRLQVALRSFFAAAGSGAA